MMTDMTTDDVIKSITEEVVKTIEENLKGRALPVQERESGKNEILDVLGRAADDPKFLHRLTGNVQEALKEYYHLTPEQKAALASGDIQKIESWVGKLDSRLATWLWCRLSQEQW